MKTRYFQNLELVEKLLLGINQIVRKGIHLIGFPLSF